MENKMLCPCCKAPLIVHEMARLQTLSEHVEDPNGEVSLKPSYICNNRNCETHYWGVHWNSDGELYCERFFSNAVSKGMFIDGNDAPFGTFSRQANVEIYKVGLRDKIYFPSWLLFNKYQLYIEFKYYSNYDGEVLKRKAELKLFKIKDGMYLHFSPATRTWGFLWKQFSRLMAHYKRTEDKKYLKRAFAKSGNRAWVYRWFEKYIQYRYKDFYELVKAD